MNSRWWVVALAVALMTLSACKKDDGEYDVPSTYDFENVDYSGQTTRLSMLAAMTTYMKTANVSGASALDAQKLKNMYANANNAFDDAALNSADKQLKNKTFPGMAEKFEEYMDSLAAASQYTSQAAAKGQAGVGLADDGNSYLYNANGFEITQLIEKGLGGACFYYQGTAVYMGDGKMNVDNEEVTEGKGTAMEHHWDEAFGYFGVPTDFPSNTSSLGLWGKYCNGRDAVLGLNSVMMDAFIKGRAAISNDDLATRDEQIDILRTNWQKVSAATAIHYFNVSKESLAKGDTEKALHQLSEAYVFTWDLKFGVGGVDISDAQIDAILTGFAGSANPLEANLYDVTIAEIDAAIDAITGYITDLDAEKANL